MGIRWRTCSRDRRNRTTMFRGEPDLIAPKGVNKLPSQDIAKGVSEYNTMKKGNRVLTHLPSIFLAAVMTSREAQLYPRTDKEIRETYQQNIAPLLRIRVVTMSVFSSVCPLRS